MSENSAKIENVLNLALDATKEELARSLDLKVGYDMEKDRWEVIIKFFGTKEELLAQIKERFPNDYESITLSNLSNEYGILDLPRSLVDAVAAMPEIEYMEKPKRMFFAVQNGKQNSCINPLQAGGSTSGRDNLTGRDVIVGIIDSGERVN